MRLMRGISGALAMGAVAWATALALVPASTPDRPVEGTPSVESESPLAGVDSLTPLADVAREASACSPGCVGIVYAWTPRMPLSRRGIPNVVRAAEDLGVRVTL